MKKSFLLGRFADNSVMSLSASTDSAVMSTSLKPKRRGLNGSEKRPARQKTNVSQICKRLIAVTLIGGLLIGCGWFYNHQQAAAMPFSATQTPEGTLSSEQFKAQYGIRILSIALALNGGVVDFQYQVVDLKKAAPLLQDPLKMPVLTTLDKGLKLYPTRMMTNPRSSKRNYAPYRFFPNARGAIKSGTPVSVSFGAVHVGPIIAQ